jgi:hypothetical protein
MSEEGTDQLVALAEDKDYPALKHGWCRVKYYQPELRS